MKTTKVLKTNVSQITIDAVSRILNTKSQQTVAICNANTLVRSVRNSYIRNVINDFDIRTPDGFPVAKALSFFSGTKFLRVDGYKVFVNTISDGIQNNTRHFFFGSDDLTTNLMINKINNLFPDVLISGYLCPEFTTAENLVAKHKEFFSSLETDIVWVSLGLPKQEIFVDLLKKEIDFKFNVVAVGGVFEWVAETKKKAPEWLANLGFEWVLRLIQDPKRLYKRYLIDNTLFILYFLRQAIFRR